jgi:hypothetical protein
MLSVIRLVSACKLYFGNGTVVQHSATDPEIKGLNPVAGFTKKKMAKKKS